MPLGNFRLGTPPTNPQNQNFGQPNWVSTGQTFLRGLQQVMPYLNQAGIQMPPGVNFLMKGLGGGFGGGLPKPSGDGGQGFQQQGVQQQRFPQQGFQQQGFPQQGFPQQGFPQQGFKQQGFPQQGFQQQGIPQQGFQQQGIPQQGYPSQGFFSQGFPPQAYQQQRGNLNNSLSVQSLPPQSSPQPQQIPQASAKSGGIKGLISRFMARRKG